MAVQQAEIERSKGYLVERGATRILLFGSALEVPEEARDLDIACAGLAPEVFYEVAGGLSRLLGREVDLVDLTDDNVFTRHLEAAGRVIYDAG